MSMPPITEAGPVDARILDGLSCMDHSATRYITDKSESSK